MPRYIVDHATREERARQIKAKLDRGLSLNEIARDLDVTPQSIHKFISSRGWKTKYMKQRDAEAE